MPASAHLIIYQNLLSAATALFALILLTLLRRKWWHLVHWLSPRDRFYFIRTHDGLYRGWHCSEGRYSWTDLPSGPVSWGRAAELLRWLPEAHHATLARDMYSAPEVLDVVVPKRSQLLYGPGSHHDAAVVHSLSPFRLISRDGSVQWRDTVAAEDFRPLHKADACDIRNLRDYERRARRQRGSI